MNKRILTVDYHVEGKRKARYSFWSFYASSGAKSLKGGKRQLKRLKREYTDRYRFRLVETRVKIVA